MSNEADFRLLQNRIRETDMELKDQSNLLCNMLSAYFGYDYLEIWYENGLYVKIRDVPDSLSGNILRLRANVPPLGGHSEIVGDDVVDLAYKDIPPQGNQDDEDAVDESDELADAVIFLHSKGIVHRDLALRNLLLSQDGQDLILCDLESCYGSKHCPEIARAKDNGLPNQEWPYSPKSDIYYFGITIAELVLQNNPRTPWQYFGNFVPPPPFDHIFRACLKENPDDRPTLAEIKEMLESIVVSAE
ncbi:hypothetical protein NP233_g11596 [Leucocoprinus birnbaumii]|uniref:Protein kinase domain-containing protein n=1 Tax=Leucocoprinus birnbaumii TaxID=56174 RepID=A0AAD5VGV1_9AGAR|nr:hypothetical protein NP233_g11596 [Leucocoprinus birnbaumii]